jgi:glutathione peroxidase
MTINRRAFLAVAGATLTGQYLTSSSPARAQMPAMSRITAYAFSFAGIDGGDIRLADYTHGPILVVNTASNCGYTPQFAGLERLFETYRDKGLMIIGVPSNNFGGQEPGTPVQILKTAHDDFGVRFPLTAKVDVRGNSPHPFYKWAAAERPLETPRWNFHKYLIGRDGHIAAVFASDVEPTDTRVIAAITREFRND